MEALDRKPAVGWLRWLYAPYREELGPRMLSRIAKHTGLTPEDI